MTAFTIEPVNAVAGTTLAIAFGPVPTGEEWSVDVRVAAIGSADAAFDLQLRKTGGTNAAYRAKAQPVRLASGTLDVERHLTIPAGYELWHRSGNTDVAASYTGTKRLTA